MAESTSAAPPAPPAAAEEAEGQQQQQQRRTPQDFLRQALGRPVEVRLNDGSAVHGVLACLDGSMNIAMEQAEYFEDEQLKAKYGDCFLRGNNVTYISAPKMDT